MGELEVRVVHYEDDSEEILYELETDEGERWDLVFEGDVPLATGDRVSVLGGAMDESRFAVDSYRIRRAGDAHGDDEDGVHSADSALTGNSVTRRNRIAVLLVHWGSPDDMTRGEMHRRMFTNPMSARNMLHESSYGINDLTGDVFDWMRVPNVNGCHVPTIRDRGLEAARNRGINLDSYDHVAIYFPRIQGCGFAGTAVLGLPTRPARMSYFNGNSTPNTLGHELLHNYGAHHARSYSCGSATLGSPSQCSYDKYGDPYDPMGGSTYQFSMYNKAAQGWLGGCNAATATANGTFQIAPTGAPSNELQVLRIPMRNSLCPEMLDGYTDCFYYVEYRQPIGTFDGQDPSSQVHQGVTVRIGGWMDFQGTTRVSYPYLLDMTPGSPEGFRDPALTVGRTFSDPSGLRITVDSVSPQRALVRVAIPGGGSGAPTCIDGSILGGGGSDTACPPGTSTFEGHCYAINPNPNNWRSSRWECQARGRGWDLAHIESAAENRFVTSLLGDGEGWLGGTDRDQEGEWVWMKGPKFWTGGSTGHPVNGRYSNWVGNEPSGGQCVRLRNNGGWRDMPCQNDGIAWNRRGVCELH